MAVPKTDRVPVGPLRDRFEFLERRYGWTAADVARDLGWWRNATKADVSRVKRSLGLSVHHAEGRQRMQQYTSYDQAVRLCRALDMDPFEAGV